MRAFLVFLFNFFLILNVFGKNIQHRDPRFIRGTYTSTVIDTSVVTSLVPSSCVQVDASLPPCRNVRYLRFPSFISNQFQDNNATEVEYKSDGTVESTVLGWGEYFGIFAPTVTVTHTKIETTVVQDPRIGVTFAVKGCRPLKLPNDLSSCSQEIPTPLTFQDILPTSTVTPNVRTSIVTTTPKNTKMIDLSAISFGTKPIGEVRDNDRNLEHVIESTRDINENYESAKPTEPLNL